MRQATLTNIYNDIMLLSDSDKKVLHGWIEKDVYHEKKVVAYTTTGQPLSRKQYIEKIEKAIAEADRNELITDEELEKEIATW
jgi:CRISPR/Cas system endoribonuclease Cas6 (RAMP superfamily)